MGYSMRVLFLQYVVIWSRVSGASKVARHFNAGLSAGRGIGVALATLEWHQRFGHLLKRR